MRIVIKLGIAALLLGVVVSQIRLEDALVIKTDGTGETVEYNGSLERTPAGAYRFHLDRNRLFVLPSDRIKGVARFDGETATITDASGAPVPIPTPPPSMKDGSSLTVTVQPSAVTILEQAHVLYLMGAFGLFLLATLIVTCRWYWLVKTQALPLQLSQAIKLTYIGYFCSAFLPGVVGGDVVKALILGHRTSSKAAAMASVMVDRLVGIIALLLLGGLMALSDLEKFYPVALPIYTVLGGGMVIAVVMRWTFLRPELMLPFWNRTILQKLPYREKVERMGTAVIRYRDHKSTVLGAMALSVLNHLLIAGIFMLCAAALGAPTGPFVSYLIAVPMITIIGALPLSPQGLGTAELASIYYLGLIGIGGTNAVLIVLLYRMILWSVSLLGGLLLAWEGTKEGAFGWRDLQGARTAVVE